MTIRNKIFLLIAVVALIIGALGLLYFRTSIDNADHISLHEAKAVANTIAFELTTCPWGSPENGSEINSYIQNVKRNLKRDIVIVDPDQKIVGDVIEAEIGTEFIHDTGDEVGKTLKDGDLRTFIEVSRDYPEGIRLMVMPLDTHEGKRLGALILEYTPLYNEILFNAKAEARTFLNYYLVSIVLALVMGYILTRNIEKSLRKVSDAAGEIASGNYDFRITKYPGGEIGNLSRNFNEMAEEIASSHKELLGTYSNLAKSEEKYHSLFDSSSDGIFVLDLEGNFVDANSSAYTRLGYTQEELLSMHISRLDPPEFAARVPERMAQIKEHGYAIFESAHMRKDGSVMPVEVNTRVIDYEGRQVLFSVIRDITERVEARRKLLESRQLLQTVIETAPT